MSQAVSPIDLVLSRLKDVKGKSPQWTAKCPAHDDTRSSLSVNLGSDHRVLLHCFAGCETEKIVAAIGLTMADLFVRDDNLVQFPPKNAATVQPSTPFEGCTLQKYSETRKLPVAFLQELGLQDSKYKGHPAVRIPYFDRDGRELLVCYRVGMQKPNRFRWPLKSKLAPYGLNRLDEAEKAGWIIVVEGPSDSQTLWHHGFPAIGLPSASYALERLGEYLQGIGKVFFVVEPGKGGETVLAALERCELHRRSLVITDLGAKDVSDLHIAHGEAFPPKFQEALERAKTFALWKAKRMDASAKAAWEKCKAIAESPSILDLFYRDLTQRGVVGEQRPAKLIYLLMETRLLQRPVSAGIKGPSSAGKSYLVEQVLQFFPESAFYKLTAMSERALAYSEEPLRHRFLVVFEAAGMEGKFAAYLIRSLLSEGRLRYETVEKTKDGLKPRLIEREGPTGLIVTTTKITLHPENETRLLSIHVTDTPQQTRRILLMQAGRANKPDSRQSLDAWHSLQDWLEATGGQASIPYAKALAELVPSVAVRLRRDFPAILSLIKAHAILHRATRQLDERGLILATLEDYAVVRELVSDLVADSVEATASPTIRETVEAVQQISEESDQRITISAVGQRLGLDKSAASRRVKAAVEKAYLQNREERRGRPADLVIGEPLPKDQPVLPSVDAVRREVDRKNATSELIEKERVNREGCTVAAKKPGLFPLLFDPEALSQASDPDPEGKGVFDI